MYYVFDVPYLDGYDLTEAPLIDRKEVLARVLLSANPDNDGTMRYSDHIQGQGESVFQHACRSAMEGIIAKRADSTYQQFRSPDWLKDQMPRSSRSSSSAAIRSRRDRASASVRCCSAITTNGDFSTPAASAPVSRTQSLKANRCRAQETRRSTSRRSRIRRPAPNAAA